MKAVCSGDDHYPKLCVVIVCGGEDFYPKQFVVVMTITQNNSL